MAEYSPSYIAEASSGDRLYLNSVESPLIVNSGEIVRYIYDISETSVKSVSVSATIGARDYVSDTRVSCEAMIELGVMDKVDTTHCTVTSTLGSKSDSWRIENANTLQHTIDSAFNNLSVTLSDGSLIDDGNGIYSQTPKQYLYIAITPSNDDGTPSSDDGTPSSVYAPTINVSASGNQSEDGGSSEPSGPKTISIVPRLSSPSSGSSAAFGMTQFTWTIQNADTPGIVYERTNVQVALSSSEQVLFTGTAQKRTSMVEISGLSANTDYMWRAQSVVSGTPSEDNTVIETPWTDWQYFRTKDYTYSTISVSGTRPKSSDSNYTYGKSINFQWNVNKGSGLNVVYSELYLDDTLFHKITGSDSSYSTDSNDINKLGAGNHTWYVTVHCVKTSDDIAAPSSATSETNSFTVGYETTTITVSLTSPENDAEFVQGNNGSDIRLQWSVNKGSGLSVGDTYVYIDGRLHGQTSGNSYAISSADSKQLITGSHTWYVVVSCTATDIGTQIDGNSQSASRTFKIKAPYATATPSSPNGSSKVDGNAPVNFTWSLSKNGDGEYTGSELEYKYSNGTTWYPIGTTEKGITAYTYTPGFTPNTVVQWHVRASLNGNPAGDFSDPISFMVGDEARYTAKPELLEPKGTIQGDSEIEFKWRVTCDGPVSQCIVEYSADQINWTKVGTVYGDKETYSLKASIDNLPSGTVYWRVRATSNSGWDTAESSFTVSYTAYGQITPINSHANSGIRRDLTQTFSAELQIVGTTTESIVFQNAQFCWKMSTGSDYATEEMDVSGTLASIRFNAFRFPTGILQWYLKSTDSKDNDTESPIYLTYILNSDIDSFPMKPINVIREASEKTEFTWGFIAANGKLSASTSIRFSLDGQKWDAPILLQNPTIQKVFGTTDASETSVANLFTGVGRYTFDENYFSAGKVYWKIRSTSSDGINGGESEGVFFVVRSVSQATSVSCNNRPFATLSWTMNGQIGYEINVDNKYGYGPFYGSDQSFVFPEPLADGTHVISVRGTNMLGIWGDWASTITEIQNQPSTRNQLNLAINADVDAALSWNPIILSADNEFLVYRDNKLIARLTSDIMKYTDRLALGKHKYQVVQKLPDGNYNVYTHSSVTMKSDVARIALLDGGAWMTLVLTLEQYPQNSFTHSRSVEKTHIMGTKYPIVEVSDFEDGNGEYKFCWPYENRAQSKLFDSLVGKAVIIKSRGEQLVCGVLESCSMTVNSQYIECSFTIEQMSTDVDLSIAVKPEGTDDVMTNLDTIYFGQMTDADLEVATTNPGYTDPHWYEDIAEAINEKLLGVSGFNKS